MKACYNLQSENPNKHSLMPGGYPWTEYLVEDGFTCPEGFSELPLADYETLKASFDLTAYLAAVVESAAMQQQKAQRNFGEQLAEVLIDELGEEIIILENAGTPIDVSLIISAIQPIKELMAFGLLKSARSALQALLISMPTYSDYLNSGITQITDFLQSNGWDS